MAVFTIPAQAITAHVELDSPGQSVPTAISRATVQLTGAAWPATPDNTRHILVWGIQINRGSGWSWWLFQGDPTESAIPVAGGYSGPTGSSVWLAFGLRSKQGTLPALTVESSNITEVAGAQVRLSILTDAPITLGATITVT